MSKVIHFEVHADDVERAKNFYANVFGWQYQDYSEYVGAPYFGVIAGEEAEQGANGAILPRGAARPALGQGLNSFCCTMGVADYDKTHDLIIKNGGEVALPKAALPGMAWQGYYIDTEGNTFGIHQPDENAK